MRGRRRRDKSRRGVLMEREALNRAKRSPFPERTDRTRIGFTRGEMRRSRGHGLYSTLDRCWRDSRWFSFSRWTTAILRTDCHKPYSFSIRQVYPLTISLSLVKPTGQLFERKSLRMNETRRSLTKDILKETHDEFCSRAVTQMRSEICDISLR